MLIRKDILLTAIMTLLAIQGCTEDEMTGGNTRWCEVEASFEETLTRVGLSTMENSRNLVAKWQEGDQMNVILCANDKYYEVGPVPVREISNDGRSCKFSYRLPENFKEPSDGYQLMCFTSNCQPKIIDNEVYYNGSLIRKPISQFKASVMSDEHASSGVFQSNFRHYYTYELLHISNKSDKDIDFALCGYSADLIWYRTLCAVRNWDGRAIYPSEAAQAAIEESPTVKIPANGSDIIVSAYIPNGQLIKNAKMTAKINGEHVHTSNLLSSNKELERGHAYHMYATWDGTELKFDNVDDNSFHLSANSISLYVNTDSPVTIFNGSGEYDVINENPDIVDYDINGVHVAHAPNRYYDMGGGHGEPIEGDLWWITAKKIGDATLKLIDKQTTKELILKVTVTQAPSLTLAQSNVEMNVGETKHVEILTGSQWYEVSTDNNGVVSVSKATISTSGGGRRGESGSSYTGIYAIIEALSAGEAVVTVKDLSSGETADINVKVSSSGDYPVAEAIDLGLPSGTKWASWNVGASAPEEYGGYYAWGETEEKDYYDWSTYKYFNSETGEYQNIGNDIAGTKYDVALEKWGSSWQMPSKDLIQELIDNCTRTWTTQNGVNGTLVTGPNGATIFLPAAGMRIGGDINHEGATGNYWSSSRNLNYEFDVYSLWDNSYFFSLNSDVFRECGLPIRPVMTLEKPQDCPIAEAIDLGLPSGTKWASWNVGASKPEEYGGYYAWGETEEKEVYGFYTYKYYNSETGETIHIGDDIAGTEYDVAHVKWGESWHMPTKAQYDELLNNCTREWMQLNGVNGILVTGPNGNTIFLPAAGYRWNEDLLDKGKEGRCRSSSSGPSWVYIFDFSSYEWSLFGGSSYNGYSVRAVIGRPSFSRYSVEMHTGDETVVEVIPGHDNYEVSNSNTSVVYAALEGKKMMLTAKNPGSAIISVKDKITGLQDSFNVFVSSPYRSNNSYKIIFYNSPTGKDETTVIKPDVTADSIAFEGAEYISDVAIGEAATVTRAYFGRIGYGLKFGNSPNPGNLLIHLSAKGQVNATSIVVKAAPWWNAETGIIDTPHATINGFHYEIDATETALKDYKIDFDKPQFIDTLFFSGTEKGRSFIKSITVYY